MRVVWTARALRDLAALRAYISQDNLPAAERQVELVLAAVAGLPDIGRPGRRSVTRELVVGRTPYLVPYGVRGELVEVLHVLHGRRWPDAL